MCFRQYLVVAEFSCSQKTHVQTSKLPVDDFKIHHQPEHKIISIVYPVALLSNISLRGNLSREKTVLAKLQYHLGSRTQKGTENFKVSVQLFRASSPYIIN